MSRVPELTRALAVLALVITGCGGDSDREEPRRTATPLPGLPPGWKAPEADPFARPAGAPSLLLDLNGDPAHAPTHNGRPGSASSTEVPPARRTSLGYEIQFATMSPVPTPTVNGPVLMVSGGFNSHEMFAVNPTTGAPIWGKTVSDDGPSNAACDGELCAFNSESCTTFAVNSRTGELLWSYWLGDPETSAPAVADGRVFASFPAGYMASYDQDGKPAANQRPVSATHVLAAFDLKTGKPLWHRWLDADVMSSPVAVNGFVYVTTFAGSVMKLEQATGVIRYAVDMRATSSPVVLAKNGVESLLVTARVEERDIAREAMLRADLGEPRPTWRANPKLAPYLDGKIQGATQAYQDGLQYDSGNGFGSTPTSANAGVAKQTVGVASVATMQRFQGSRALVVGDHVISTMGDEVVSVDLESGATAWRHALPGDVRNDGGHLGTAPILAGKEIIVATLGGEVLRLDAKTGEAIKSYKTGAPLRSQPIAWNGWIYAGTEDGRLIAIDTGIAALTGWPTWGGDAGRTSIR